MAEKQCNLVKNGGGDSVWESVPVTVADTSHTSTTITCRVNKSLKLAYITGVGYSLTSGNNTAFTGAPTPLETVRIPATDNANKAGVAYLYTSGNIIFVGGVNNYLNFNLIYPIA